MSNIVEFPGAPESAAGPQPAPVYAELAVTTNFSFLRGASHPEELMRQAAALGLAGIGIADRNSVAGVVQREYTAYVDPLRFVPRSTSNAFALGATGRRCGAAPLRDTTRW